MYTQYFNIDSGIFVAFLIANIVFGLYSSSGIKGIKEYAIGNQTFSTVAIAATLVATRISGSDFFIYLSEAYSDGLYFIWAATGDVLCLLLIGYYFSPRLGEFIGKLSIAEAMGELYGQKVRVITAIASCIGATGMIAVQLKVAGSLIGYGFEQIPQEYGIIIASTIVALYTSLGGIKSVTFTDIIQLLTFGTIIPTIAFFVLGSLDTIETLNNTVVNSPLFNYKEVFDFSQPKSLTYLFLFLFIAVPGFDPTIFQRISMAKSTVQVRRSFIIAGFTCLFITLTMSFIGVSILATKPGIAPTDIVKHILINNSYIGLKGLTLAGIMAMVMSTVDSFINSTAVIVVHDLCKPLGIIINRELLYSRITSAIISVIGLVIALSSKNLLNTIIAANSFYLPIVTMPFMLATFGFRSSSKSVMIGMLAGFTTVVVWQNFNQLQLINAVIPGMVANATFLISSHYVLKQPGGWIGIKDKTPLEVIRKERQVKIMQFKNYLQNFNLFTFLQKNTPKQESIYAYLGIFCIISMYSTMYTLPKAIKFQYPTIVSFVPPSVLFLSTILISYLLWPTRWSKKSNIISIIWNITVFYALVCVGFLFVITSNFSQFQVLVFMINLIIIASLLRWQWAITMIIGGIGGTSYLFSYFIDSSTLEHLNISLQFKVIYLLLLVSSILILFVKPKQELYEIAEEKIGHLNTRIEHREQELGKALELKNEFLRNISHEVRTPMVGITSLGPILSQMYDQLKPEQVKSYIDEIAKNSTRLESLMYNILDLSALTSLSAKLYLKLINLSQLVLERAKVCRKLYLYGKDLELTLNVEDNLIVSCDEYYIKQTIDNLIINAINYGKEGNIILELRSIKSTRKNDDEKFTSVEFMIQDQGIGIPKSELYDIFGSFIVSSKTHTPAGGRGVGLALCKKVIDLHQGKIWAESNGEKGATFRFTIPR